MGPRWEISVIVPPTVVATEEFTTESSDGVGPWIPEAPTTADRDIPWSGIHSLAAEFPGDNLATGDVIVEPVSVAAPVAHPPQPVVVRFPSLPTISWMHVVISIWAIGVAVSVVRFATGRRRLHRLCGDSEPADPNWQERTRRVAADMKVFVVPRVNISSSIGSPMLVGVRHPTILLPEWLNSRCEVEKSACLAHELAHAGGRDIAWGIVGYAARSALWFHPLAWWILAYHERSCEEVSDDEAARVVGDRRAYAGCLARLRLHVNHVQQEVNLSIAGGMSMARLSGLSRRLRRLTHQVQSGPLTAMRVLTTTCLALTLIVGLTSLRARAAAPKVEGPAAPGESWTDDLSPIADADWNEDRAAHLLERAGFGGTPADVAKLARMTPMEAVTYLVDYESIPNDGLPEFEHSGIYPNGHKVIRPLQDAIAPALLTGRIFGIKAVDEGGKLPYQPAVDEFYTLLVSEHTEMRRAGPWWAERMLLTARPLEEKMTLFWHDHFATSQEKVIRYQRMLKQIETLRENATGNYRDMLIAIAQDPAMLIWLDNRDNLKGKPNENFAREIMELFCMGEGKGYSETDIREIARAFTGWTMTRDNTVKEEGKFVDDPKVHDDGEKSFLGQKGNFNGTDAIDIILKQPATSRYIAGKIYKWFVREDLSAAMNDALAKKLVELNYEFKPFLKTIFLSKDFYSVPSVGTQIKSPVHLIVSTCRKMGLRQLPGIPDFGETCDTLGQVLFFPPNVAGWTDGPAWINPSTLLARGNFVHTLLFPNPESYGHPDKEIVESYRMIPILLPEQNITPRLWNAKLGKMEPVSMEVYKEHLALLNDGAVGTAMAADKKGMSAAEMTRPSKDAVMGESKMAKMSDGEKYNLGVGVYNGFCEAYNRSKPIPRNVIDVDFVRMVDEAGVKTADEAVDHFIKRFLRVPMYAAEREAIIAFLKNEIGSDTIKPGDANLETALRRVVHLILSSPEYQLG
jgi:beta-lactamase regulating signal transducer with metallopeptidase domain